MNWAQRRKLGYIAIVAAFFGIVGFVIIHKATAVAPSCFDNRQDGTETGIDCGGTCNTYCAGQLSDPIIEWTRVFPVTPGIATAVAYIQHNHPLAVAENVGYEFKFYDANNTLIGTRTGTTYLGPAGESAIVETLVPVDSSKVALARFSFIDPIHWQKVLPAFSQIVINTDRHAVESFTTGTQVNTRLTAALENQSRFNFTNLEAVAIFYDQDGNAITASKVLVPSLGALQDRTVYFTWPYAVSSAARVQVIPRFNPFTSQSL
jgi:hypothetical protein